MKNQINMLKNFLMEGIIMTKLELKRQILKDARSVDTFFISVIVWHGDSAEYNDAVYLDVIGYQGTPEEKSGIYLNEEKIGYAYGSLLEDTKENTEKIRKEQKDLVKYLTKQGFTVITSEENV